MSKLQKKGVSPLIAVVILIAIVVGLGEVILNIARDYIDANEQGIDERTKRQACTIDTEFELLETEDGKLDVCADGDSIRFTLENGPLVELAGFKATAIGEENIGQGEDSSLSIATGDIEQVTINYDADGAFTGALKQIKITPYVQLPRTPAPELCVDAAITVYPGDMGAC